MATAVCEVGEGTRGGVSGAAVLAKGQQVLCPRRHWCVAVVGGGGWGASYGTDMKGAAG